MKLLLVLVGLAVAQNSWPDDFNPESAYLSIISLRRDFEPANETVSLNDDEDVAPEESEDMSPSPPPPGRPGPPGPRDDCGAWGPWEQTKCFWPSDSLDNLPASCAAIPTKPDWPAWMKKFVVSKAMEKYNMLMDEYKTRGAPPKCGYCTRSFECRIRNDTTSVRKFCPMKEVRPLFERDCDDNMACEVSQERGGCPPPLFLGGGRREKLQGMIRQGNHEGFSNELYKMRMMDDASEGGRQKRQADFPRFQENSASFMPFDPQFDFPYEGPQETMQGPMGRPFDSDNSNGSKRRGPQEGRGQGPRRGGEGRRGPGQRGGGPGERRGHGGPERQGAPIEEQNFPVQPSFDFPSQLGPRVPGRSQSPPDFPFFPSNDDQFPAEPMGPSFRPGRPDGPRPSFGPGQGFPPRRPFGPGSERQPFGQRPGPSDDAPFPRFNGPMGDGRGPRVERQSGPFGDRQRSFQQPFGPGLSGAPRFSMFFNNQRRGMSAPMRFGPRRSFGPPPPPHHSFLMDLFHGTTCASNGSGKCLCCCGHYLPNIETGACEDLKQLLPGIEKMVDNVDRENKPPQTSFNKQTRQMNKQMKKQFVDF